MSAQPELDIACFSYLAGVSTLHVTTYPTSDYGVGVERVERFLAGDGPIVAGAAVAFGLKATLISNSVVEDEIGLYLASVLERWGVNVPRAEAGSLRRETPFSTVVSARDGSRAWFAYLPDVVAELGQVELEPISRCRLAYVDCYELFGAVSMRPVTFALDHDVPVFANLGGSPTPEWLSRDRITRKLLVLQTSVPEDLSVSASTMAAELAALSVAEHIVVTRGRHGAVLVDRERTYEIEAPSVPVKAVQGAGSVFSAALATCLLTGEGPREAVRQACAAASQWCATNDFPASSHRRS